MKSEFLYHGSQYLFDKLIPQQACGLSHENGDKIGIYACEIFDWVIPFSLPIRWYPDDPTGKRSFTCNECNVKIIHGTVDPNGFGYVYKLSFESFIRIDKWQWLSEVETIPIEITKIYVKDYWKKISFSNEARIIQNLVYPTL